MYGVFQDAQKKKKNTSSDKKININSHRNHNSKNINNSNNSIDDNDPKDHAIAKSLENTLS